MGRPMQEPQSHCPRRAFLVGCGVVWVFNPFVLFPGVRAGPEDSIC